MSCFSFFFFFSFLRVSIHVERSSVSWWWAHLSQGEEDEAVAFAKFAFWERVMRERRIARAVPTEIFSQQISGSEQTGERDTAEKTKWHF